MKFGKKLRTTIDQSYEEWRSKFMNYKGLKKCINPRPLSTDDNASKDSDSVDGDQEQPKNLNQNQHHLNIRTPQILSKNIHAIREAENNLPHFFSTFRREVDKVNDFYLDKEEDYIIEHSQLSVKVDEYCLPGRATKTEVSRLYQRIINFHGELVRLENFSTVNYTGFRKILKKHDKKTGSTIHDIYLGTVLNTPFYLCDTVRQLIQNTEAQLSKLENVRKFRRIVPATNVSNPIITSNQKDISSIPTPTTITSPLQSITPKPSSINHNLTPSTSTPSAVIPLASSPCTQFFLTHSRPQPFISPRPPLFRLYDKASSYGDQVHIALQNCSDGETIPSPSRALIDNIDEIKPLELGLQNSFLQAIKQPSNYCIASKPNFSIGFLVLPANTNLQIFRAKKDGTIIFRNLIGKLDTKCYATCQNGSTSTSASEPPTDDFSEDYVNLFVEETRNALTTGPWPSITIKTGETHVEFHARTNCALFYVSAASTLEDSFQKFDVCPLAPPRARVCSISKSSLQVVKFLC